MEWWHKIRRAWVAITARLLKARKNGNGKSQSNDNGGSQASNSNNTNINRGLLNLQHDVETCDYEDIHVLWNMLCRMQAEEEAVAETSSANEQNKPSWRTYLCSINPQSTSFALLA